MLKSIKLSAFADESASSLEEQIASLKENNIHFLELRSINGKNVSEFSLEEANEFAKVLKNNDIEVFSIGSPLGKVDINIDFNEYKNVIVNVFKIANVFKAKYVRVFSFFNALKNENLVYKYLSEMVEMASKYDLILCHENEKDIFVDKIERILMIKKNVPNLEYVFDPANFIQVNENIDEAIEKVLPFCTYIHIKDCLKDTLEVVPSGFGSTNFSQLLHYINKEEIACSLEPHLKVFRGYNSIDKTKLKNKFEYESNKIAFKASSDSFKHVLSENGFKEHGYEFKKEVIRYGIIGVGNQGTYYNNELFDKNKIKNAEVKAICDIDLAKIERIKGKTINKNITYFLDAETMIKSHLIDAVLIETPHYIHPDLASLALKNNINVILDKPAGVYTKQVKELNEFSNGKKAKFTMMFNQRTNPLYIKMRSLVLDGSIGEFLRVNWIITDWFRTKHYYESGNWRATWDKEGGGVLINQCPHQIDLIQWIINKSPISVRAICKYGHYHDILVEDDVSAYFEYDNGASGVFITTTGEAPGTNRLEITGTKGKLVCENDALTFYKNEIDSTTFLNTSKESFSKPNVEVVKIELGKENPQHAGIINNFTSYLLGKEELFVEGEEGIKGVMLMNAIELSGWLDGIKINLPVDEDKYLEILKSKF